MFVYCWVMLTCTVLIYSLTLVAFSLWQYCLSFESLNMLIISIDLQKFYENLASKARPKVRSPSRSSSPEDDLGQRLEAKLLAAEEKR